MYYSAFISTIILIYSANNMQLLTQYRATKKLQKKYYKAVIVEQCAEIVLMSFYFV